MACEDCINGHQPDCEALEPAWDAGDLISRSPCRGCCPNGCRPRGLQRTQDEAAIRVRQMLDYFLGWRDRP